METIFYHVDAKQITCQASEDRKASGAAGEVRCVVVPRKKSAAAERGRGTVVDMMEYRKRREAPPEPVEAELVELEDSTDESKGRWRAAFGLVLDLCATAAIVGVCIVAAIRLFLL